MKPIFTKSRNSQEVHVETLTKHNHFAILRRMVVAATNQDLTRVVPVISRLQSVDLQLERDLVALHQLRHLVLGVSVDDRVVFIVENDLVVLGYRRLRVFVDPVYLKINSSIISCTMSCTYADVNTCTCSCTVTCT